jgi:hypothetical protein
MYVLCAADLIHGTEIVYSEDSESNRPAYQQRFRCDLWFLSEQQLDNFSLGTE